LGDQRQGDAFGVDVGPDVAVGNPGAEVLADLAGEQVVAFGEYGAQLRGRADRLCPQQQERPRVLVPGADLVDVACGPLPQPAQARTGCLRRSHPLLGSGDQRREQCLSGPEHVVHDAPAVAGQSADLLQGHRPRPAGRHQRGGRVEEAPLGLLPALPLRARPRRGRPRSLRRHDQRTASKKPVICASRPSSP
jgi:hypothetical protein